MPLLVDLLNLVFSILHAGSTAHDTTPPRRWGPLRRLPGPSGGRLQRSHRNLLASWDSVWRSVSRWRAGGGPSRYARPRQNAFARRAPNAASWSCIGGMPIHARGSAGQQPATRRGGQLGHHGDFRHREKGCACPRGRTVRDYCCSGIAAARECCQIHGGASHCQYCRSAAPPSSFSRRFNMTGEGVSAE